MRLREWLSAIAGRTTRRVPRGGDLIDRGVEPRESAEALVLRRLSGHEPIRVPIAGVMHQDRLRYVRHLILGELVRLRRDLGNEFDSNAIRVEARSGQHLGYVPRNIAGKLASYIEERQYLLDAVVTELTSDVDASVVGAAVTFYAPATLVTDILSQAGGWEFCCDTLPEGATYLMLNCDEAELTRVTVALDQSGLHPVRSGFSYSQVSDGRQYRWYVRLESAPHRERPLCQ